jgi:hypothetical protein
VVGGCLSKLGIEVLLQSLDVPLPSYGLIIAFSQLLDGDVGEVDLGVLYFGLVITAVCEASESSSVEVDGEWGEGSDEGVETHVELFATD